MEIDDYEAVNDKPFLHVSSEKTKGKVCDQVPSFNISENTNYHYWAGDEALWAKGQGMIGHMNRMSS